MAIQLDLSSLENALQRLEEALQAHSADPQNTLYRDACIQRFEFCYEQSIVSQRSRHMERIICRCAN